MEFAKRAVLRKRIIGYVNIFAIILGITHLRLNFQKHRVERSTYIHAYVICANVATIALMPFAYVEQIIMLAKSYKHKVAIFINCVNMFITFGAVIVSVLLRWRNEALYLDTANALFQLDSEYFGQLCIDNAVERRSDYLIFFKVLISTINAIAPFYGSIQFSVAFDLYRLLACLYYGYVHNMLFGTLFLYFYLMWLLRKRFSLLNTKLNDLFRSLEQLQGGNEASTQLQQQKSNALATKDLLRMARIYAQLSAMTMRLNADFNVQILAGLLTQLINGISYGYFAYMLNKGQLDIVLETPAFVLATVFTLVMVLDGNLLHWIAGTTAHTCQSTSQSLRSFQVLPVVDTGFEQQCELFALQLKLQNREITVAGLFSLNLPALAAVLAFSFRHILILVQFDYEARMQNAEESVVLDKFNKFFGLNYF